MRWLIIGKPGDDESICDRSQVFFIQYRKSPSGYHRIMARTEIPYPRPEHRNATPRRHTALAAGLFGYSISEGQMHSFKATEGYLRDIEQMPNFAPPSARTFVAQYLASHIGSTNGSH
ncbi:hypothetical protein [Parasphingorhabdus sp.]|uniref:hypothetical protein n=1 Tax=Parasphingorhabdus sp. TaxID=2709688 RepID=UPI003A92DC49